jgi:hypothetical protein
LTFGQSAHYKSCGKYSNLYLCKISDFSEIPKYFSYFLFSHDDLFNWKKDLNLKYRRGLLSPRPAQLDASPVLIQRAKSAASSIFLGMLSSGPQRLADPTRQPLYFVGRNHFAPDPLQRPVPSQTRPLPLLARVAMPTELPPTSQPPVTTSRLKGVHVCACPLSRHVDCGVP